MRHERLDVVSHRQALEVAGEQEHRGFPPEREHQPDDDWPLQPRANEREDGAIRREPDRQHPEIGHQRRKRVTDRAADRRDQQIDEHH